jgi:hypothetical protein
MKVNEAIEFLTKFTWLYPRQYGKTHIRKIVLLLKSLEAENKELKSQNKKIRKWINVSRKRYLALQAENKALKKENKAYRGMWKEAKKRFFSCEIVEVNEVISKLEEKYLGGTK